MAENNFRKTITDTELNEVPLKRKTICPQSEMNKMLNDARRHA